LKDTEKRPNPLKTEVLIYADKWTPNPFDQLKEELPRHVQQPDNDDLRSTLRYSYRLAKAVLSALPSAQLALIVQGATGDVPKRKRLRNWAIRSVLSRRDLQSSTNDFPSFNLRVVTNMDGVLSNIGPSAATSGLSSPWDLILDLHLRPKVSPPVAPHGESADKSTQPVEDLVSGLVEDLWSSLRGRQFTSVVSWNEAVVMYLTSSFGRSKFGQYLELEDMRVVSTLGSPGTHILRYIHDPPSSTANLQGWHLGNDSLFNVLKLRQRTATTIENEAAPMLVSLHQSTREY
jgi:hypothetical protein